MRFIFLVVALALVGFAYPEGSAANAQTADSILANKKAQRAVGCSPARYGTPGCPYPSLGKRKKIPRSPGPCPTGTFKGQDGTCYPALR